MGSRGILIMSNMHTCVHARLTCMRFAPRDPYADVLWMNLMTERTDAQRETVKLYESNLLNDDWQDAQIKLGSGLNEFGQSKNSLQAQVSEADTPSMCMHAIMAGQSARRML